MRPFQLSYWKWLRLGLLLSIDVTTIGVCWWASFALRLDSLELEGLLDIFWLLLPIVILSHVAVFFITGMYRQVWRYANINSAGLVARSTFAGTLVASGLFFLLYRDHLPPRSVPIIYWMLATGTIIINRFSWRIWISLQTAKEFDAQTRCLVYGAGSAGELFARHVAANPNFPHKVVGFIDDDRNKTGRILGGLKILGTSEELWQLATEHNVSVVILALHSASGKVIRAIVARCQDAGLKPLIMPEMASTLSQSVIVQPRAVDVKDLLRRSTKSTDLNLIHRYFHQRTVLVTGAGGSIGAEICRQVAGLGISRLILFDASEYNLYKIDLELRELGFADRIKIHPVLGSTLDKPTVHRLFHQFAPSCVLHAAAYKHVPLVECNPITGILNNVLGTKIVAEAAQLFNAERFVLISTDKAVRPTNIMGGTKRVCEILIQALQQKSTGCSFSAVRFGNVLGSSGSVIPRFLEQIQSGGPVTVTHPEVTRYFMLTSEAVGLVLQSLAMARGGETFVLNMGEPVLIYEMAQQLVKLAGKQPGRDIEIIFTGLRPGEKLYEELILEGSEIKTVHDDVFVATPYDFDSESAMQTITQLIEAAMNDDEGDCRHILQRFADYTATVVAEPPIDSDSTRVFRDHKLQPVH